MKPLKPSLAPAATATAEAGRPTRPGSERRKTLCRSAVGAAAIIAGSMMGLGQAAAEPLSAPSFGGPLRPNPDPMSMDAGVFGRLHINEGYGFGSNFDKRDQVRGMFEAGVLF